MASGPLVLGPLLRYVDATSAVVWVEVAAPAIVSVHADGRSWTSPTFSAHEHHFAIVDVDDLEPGSSQEYTVAVDGAPVWPPTEGDGAALPPSRIRTIDPDRPLHFAFGSCRTSVPHDAEHDDSHGIDVLRAFALRMMRTDGQESWPDFVLFLGDQVYADITSDTMQEFIAARRSLDEPPGTELKDFEEYAYLYELAWSDPVNRWLLSTLPSLMIFDDHDIRDDWNTSAAWREEMNATSWWHGRIMGGLASYWVYQHLGNLSPADRAEDELWQLVLERRERGEDDITVAVDELAARADANPDSYRWSHARDVNGCRVIVVDSRAARILEPGARRILDPVETQWLDRQLRGGVEHVFIGTSLPYLLPMGLHEAEAWNEAVADGAWGSRARGFGEKVRQGVDLEHWAAFQDSFRELAATVTDLASGRRGDAPATVTFLSGDVHNSYVAEVDRGPRAYGDTRILQAVCSPIRNPLPRVIRMAQSLTSRRGPVAFTRWLARRAQVPEPPFTWSLVRGPWFDNMLATVRVDGRELVLSWEAADQDDERSGPVLREVACFEV